MAVGHRTLLLVVVVEAPIGAGSGLLGLLLLLAGVLAGGRRVQRRDPDLVLCRRDRLDDARGLGIKFRRFLGVTSGSSGVTGELLRFRCAIVRVVADRDLVRLRDVPFVGR